MNKNTRTYQSHPPIVCRGLWGVDNLNSYRGGGKWIGVRDTVYGVLGFSIRGATQLERIPNAIKRTCGAPSCCRLIISVWLANKFDFERIVWDWNAPTVLTDCKFSSIWVLLYHEKVKTAVMNNIQLNLKHIVQNLVNNTGFLDSTQVFL